MITDVSCTFDVQPAPAITHGTFNDGKRTSPVNCRLLRWPELETQVFQSAEGDIVEIPCHSKQGGEPISMILIIPKAGWLQYLHNGMTKDQFFQLLVPLIFDRKPTKIEFSLPALRGRRPYSQLILEESGESPVRFAKPVQPVHVHIDHSGTEAARVTAAACMMACVSDLPCIVVNRPFGVVYVDLRRSAILLSAAVDSVLDQ